MMVLQEQRDNPRLNTYLNSSIKDNFNDNRVFSITRNLSVTGAYLTAKKELNQGSMIDCTVSLDGDAVTFTGEVVRTLEDGSYFGYGVEITDITEDSRRKLEEFIDSGFAGVMPYVEPVYNRESSAQSSISYNDGAEYDINYVQTDGKESRLVQAGFPFNAALEDYDFTYQAPILKSQIDDLLSMDWVEEANNVIFFGPTGSGKTHMAIALGKEAIKKGYKVSFVTMSELLNLLKMERVYTENRFKLARIMESRVIVIDEMGLLPASKQDANMLFQFISKIYGKTSVVMTTDLTFEQLKEAIGDDGVINLLLDKLTHNIWLRSLIN